MMSRDNLTRGNLSHGDILRSGLHHSDRGSQYCAHEYGKLLDQFGMMASMSRRGNCYDNAHMKNWGLLKNELVHHRIYRNILQAAAQAGSIRLPVFRSI